MQIKLEGKTCTLSVTLTRWKAAFIMLMACLIIGLPIHSCNNANEKLKIALKQPVKPSSTPIVTEPIVSPYALAPEAKQVLNSWLLYGVENGYDNMINKYREVTHNQKEYTPFLYIIETEWRLGRWYSVQKP